MSVSEKQKEYAKKHQTEKLDTITIRPEKGTKERWKKEADRREQSLTQFVIDSVEKEIRNTDQEGEG